MKIFINNEAYECVENSTILHLIAHLKIENTRGTAFAVNNKIVLKNEWNDFHLNENDKVVLIRATQGG